MKVNPIPFELGVARESLPIAKGVQHHKDEQPAKSQSSTAKASETSTPAPIPVPSVVNGLGLSLEFRVDKETGESVIRVLDSESGKVVRQIPAEEVLAFLRHIENQSGPLISLKL